MRRCVGSPRHQRRDARENIGRSSEGSWIPRIVTKRHPSVNLWDEKHSGRFLLPELLAIVQSLTMMSWCATLFHTLPTRFHAFPPLYLSRYEEVLKRITSADIGAGSWLRLRHSDLSAQNFFWSNRSVFAQAVAVYTFFG